ncbi:MAG: S-layer homology domain-containing protein, partial [Candidatus Riflebacteria bacterium]|nr:S-layer homology domain-containing protein [Candidatus Riflebacteria bacterium]
DSFAKDRLNAGKINYKDITIEQPEYESLLKLAGCGITMGYGDGRFAGDENVTWYETANLFNEIIKYSALVAQPEVKQNKLAEKSDIENFKALLLAKKEKIRLILNSGKKIR